MDISELRAAFTYYPIEGRLIARRTSREITGPYRRTDLRAPYATARFQGKAYPASRVIWAIVTGQWPESSLVIDHINGDTHDNRFVNLRLVTHAENLLNTKASREWLASPEVQVLINEAKRTEPTP